jgi:hypothetical protein
MVYSDRCTGKMVVVCIIVALHFCISGMTEEKHEETQDILALARDLNLGLPEHESWAKCKRLSSVCCI